MSDFLDVAPGLLVATSRRDRTNSVILSSITEAMLVDPAWDPNELADIAAELEFRGLRVVGGFSTHAHHDHVLWHPAFGAAPRFGSEQTVALAAENRSAFLEALGPKFAESTAAGASNPGLASSTAQPSLGDLVGRLQAPPHSPTDRSRIWMPRGTVPAGFDPRFIIHNGHCPGHTAIWLPAQRVLIAGDMLSDLELPLPYTAENLAAYSAGLDALRPYAEQADVLIPGHGSVAFGADASISRWEADRRYIDRVVAGTAVVDDRLDNPGMRETHDALVANIRAVKC